MGLSNIEAWLMVAGWRPATREEGQGGDVKVPESLVLCNRTPSIVAARSVRSPPLPSVWAVSDGEGLWPYRWASPRPERR